ncbi:MAG TPA: MmcQ/YjbR family DNA-binding protein [Bacteroidia bacterium]|jgi:hypothetical protein
MISITELRKVALCFEGAVEQPHIELSSFRVRNKIFATLDEKNKRVCLMLSKEEQSVFCAYDKTVMYPVPNKWGLNGATYADLATVPKPMLKDALNLAYLRASEKKKK